jgi:hypothetical protein
MAPVLRIAACQRNRTGDGYGLRGGDIPLRHYLVHGSKSLAQSASQAKGEALCFDIEIYEQHVRLVAVSPRRHRYEFRELPSESCLTNATLHTVKCHHRYRLTLLVSHPPHRDFLMFQHSRGPPFLLFSRDNVKSGQSVTTLKPTSGA